jgi:Xaa-Pro aminopeptidase
MNPDFFSANRRAILKQLQGGALIVLSGYGEMQAVNDSAASFVQEANFWYLSGIEQANWWIVLDGLHGTEWFVSPELSETQKVFDGAYDANNIKRISGVKSIISRDDAVRRLRELAKHHSIVYTTEQPAYLKDHAHFQLNTAQFELKKMLDRTFQNVQSCNKELARLRTIKHPDEIKAIEKAVSLTSSAITAMKSRLDTAKYEYELGAELTYIMQSRGAGHAYDPIVASGKNACTLHYVANNDRLSKKELLLIDAGARVNGYAADISRTFAIGQPSKRQLAVHAAVVEAQQNIIQLLKPGLSFKEYDEKVELIMKNALEKLGLSTERYREYFPHSVGHGLGRDVHDPLFGYDELVTNMVLTVEPGIYIRDEGIGVRIEDDILITENGHRNLSKAISTDIR